MTLFDYAKDMLNNPQRYAKFWVALGAAVLNLLTVYFPDQLWLPIAVGFAGAFGVVAVPNKK